MKGSSPPSPPGVDDQDLDAALERLAMTRDRTLELLSGHSQEILDRRPSPASWSAGEVFDHLVLSEGIYREELAGLIHLARSGRPARVRRSFTDLDVSVAFIPKMALPLLEIPFTVTNLLLPAAVRDYLARSRWLPAQNPSAATPHVGRSAAELRLDLESSLAATHRLIDQNRDLDLRTMVLQHPLLGANDGLGILRFVALHEERHQGQIREALAAAAATARVSSASGP